MSETVVLKTERFSLRPTCAEDEPGIAAAGRDPAIRAMPWFGEGFQDSWAGPWVRRAMADADGHYLFSVDDRANGYIGSVVLCRIADNATELAYWILADHRRHGVATEAVTALVQWARGNLPGVRIWAKTSKDNMASRRVLTKCGFEERSRGAVVYFEFPD